MAIGINKVYEKIRSFDVELLAGSNGMNRSARWYHMVESLEISTFLTGNEIVFITGVALRSPKELFEIIQSAHSHHACALVINLGPYIESVPENVTDFCNKNDFPLFVVPWHIHMADIMHSISEMLAESENSTDISELSKALTQAILEPENVEAYRIQLDSLGFGMNNTLQVAFTETSKAKLPSIPHGCSAVKLNIKDKNAIILCGFCRAELRRFVDLCSQNSVSLYVGLSVDSVSQLHKSYSNAAALFSSRKAFPDYKNGIIFEDTGIFGLIMSVGDKSITENFYAETLGILRQFDKNNKNDCCRALKAYLMNNSSIKEASAEIGMHKNTLLNRLHKVEELLCGDLSDIMFKCRLVTAFIIEEFMQK